MKEGKIKNVWYLDANGEKKNYSRKAINVYHAFNFRQLETDVDTMKKMMRDKSYLPSWATDEEGPGFSREEVINMVIENSVVLMNKNNDIVNAIEDAIYKDVEDELNRLWYQDISDSLKQIAANTKAIGEELQHGK
tara:strand:- start:817 stop:1224 length:408 start_codon:yes stop_codon:yes gene_type:complete